MGVYLSVPNYEEYFLNVSNPIILNDLIDTDEDTQDSINKIIYTRFSKDGDANSLYTNIVRCDCGALEGLYNEGLECEECRTKVSVEFSKKLDPLLWIRAPNNVVSLVNPTFWAMLNKYYTVAGFKVIEWICTKTKQNNVKSLTLMASLLEHFNKYNLKLGYNEFVINFDTYIEALNSYSKFKTKKNSESDLHLFITKYRKLLFPKYLPVINKAIIIIDENHSGTYIDPNIVGCIDAINTFKGIDTRNSKNNEKKTVLALNKFCEYYDNLIKNTIAQHKGIFRKHVFGTRCHWSFRAVISSVTKPHNYDEIEISWSVAVSLLSMHISNKLIKRGYSTNQIMHMLNAYARKYNKVIDEVMQELIDESAYKGIPAVIQRNPTLYRGSAQSVFITNINKNPDILTTSLSILICKAMNADSMIM